MDHTVKLWDIATGKKLHTLAEHLDSVTSVAFSPNGRFAFSANADQTMILWDIATGRWLANLISFNYGTWVGVDPDGSFDAANGGDVQGLHWVVHNEPIALSQLKELVLRFRLSSQTDGLQQRTSSAPGAI